LTFKVHGVGGWREKTGVYIKNIYKGRIMADNGA